jgi:hypothetical protein
LYTILGKGNVKRGRLRECFEKLNFILSGKVGESGFIFIQANWALPEQFSVL